MKLQPSAEDDLAKSQKYLGLHSPFKRSLGVELVLFAGQKGCGELSYFKIAPVSVPASQAIRNCANHLSAIDSFRSKIELSYPAPFTKWEDFFFHAFHLTRGHWESQQVLAVPRAF